MHIMRENSRKTKSMAEVYWSPRKESIKETFLILSLMGRENLHGGTEIHIKETGLMVKVMEKAKLLIE